MIDPVSSTPSSTESTLSLVFTRDFFNNIYSCIFGRFMLVYTYSLIFMSAQVFRSLACGALRKPKPIRVRDACRIPTQAPAACSLWKRSALAKARTATPPPARSAAPTPADSAAPDCASAPVQCTPDYASAQFDGRKQMGSSHRLGRFDGSNGLETARTEGSESMRH